MEATEQDVIIKSQLDEDYLAGCKGTYESVDLRLTYEWLMIEKKLKEQKWFLKTYRDRGLLMVCAEESKYYYTYESVITITFDDTRPTELSLLGAWEYLNYKNIPYYVRMLRADITDRVPPIIRKVWEEVEAA